MYMRKQKYIIHLAIPKRINELPIITKKSRMMSHMHECLPVYKYSEINA